MSRETASAPPLPSPPSQEDGVVIQAVYDESTEPTLTTMIPQPREKRVAAAVAQPWTNIGRFTLRDAVVNNHPLIREQMENMRHFWMVLRNFGRGRPGRAGVPKLAPSMAS